METKGKLQQRLAGKVALITGGTKGIGLATASRFLAEGATVIISSRKQANVEEAMHILQKEVSQAHCTETTANAHNHNHNHHHNRHEPQKQRVYGVASHAGNESAIKQLIDTIVNELKLPQIDILILNAATNPHFGDIMTAETSHWNKTFDVNLKGPFLLCKYALPHMRNHSSIIFNSSVGAYRISGGNTLYCVLKLALNGLVYALVDSPTIKKKQIRVNGVAPGLVRTKMSQAIIDLYNDPSTGYKRQFDARTPLKRFGLPDEIASTFAFLASDDASYINGEIIIVSGGAMSRL